MAGTSSSSPVATVCAVGNFAAGRLLGSAASAELRVKPVAMTVTLISSRASGSNTVP